MLLLLLIIIQQLFTNSMGLFEDNDLVFNLQSGQTMTISSPFYPNFTYRPGSSGRYVVIAPNGYQIQVECSFNIPKAATQCDSELLYIATDYNLNLLGSEYLCGSGNVSRVSLFNRLIVAYTSTSTYNSGYFTCFVSVPRTQAPCDCGWSRQGKIIGGSVTEVNEYVSMVGLIYRPSGSLFCGAAIISYRYIMTAAHCFDTFNTPSDIVARLGDHDLTTMVDTVYGIDMDIINIKRHEQYDVQSSANDIAILTTATDIIYTRGVGPACLPWMYDSYFFNAQILQAAGWGSTRFGGPLSSTLRHVGLNVISNSVCVLNFPDLVQSQLCTYTAGKDTCQTDSGGALYYRTTRSFAVAVISYGVACATTVPSVNTRVNSFLDWIQANTPGAQYCSLVFYA